METKDPVVHHRFAPESQLAGHSLTSQVSTSLTEEKNFKYKLLVYNVFTSVLILLKLVTSVTSATNSPKVYQQMYQFNPLF